MKLLIIITSLFLVGGIINKTIVETKIPKETFCDSCTGICQNYPIKNEGICQ